MLGDTPMLRQTQRRLSDTGLRVLEVEGVSIVPDRPIETFRRLPDLLESAAVLGAEFLTVASFDGDLERGASELAKVCAMCAPYGLTPVVEFMARSGVASLHDARELVRSPGCERASVLLDMLHFTRTGGTLQDLQSDGGDGIGLLQLCDAPLSPPNDEAALRAESRHRLLPGEGEFPLRSVVRSLPGQLSISVECPSDRYAGCTADERATLAMLATRGVLQQ